MTYDVAVLIEQELSEADARQVYGLHESLEGPVRYHVLLPVQDAGMHIEAGLAAVGGGTGLPPNLVLPDVIAQDLIDLSTAALDRTTSRLQRLGADAVGSPVLREPIAALIEAVAENDAREAIIMTRPHVVAEFLHLDWTSRARRHLSVPTLHLLEHSA